MNSKLRDVLLVFNTIISSLLLLVLFFGGLIYADTNGIWHEAGDVRPGNFGEDEDGYGSDSIYYIFNNPMKCTKDSYFDSNVIIGGELKVDVIKSNSGSSVEIQLG